MKTKSVKLSPRTKELYEKRNRALNIEGQICKYYRPLKTAVSVRIDNDVLAWLRSKGDGHISRVNEILRSAMLSGLKRSRIGP